jgi:hypothetical protein
MIKRVVTENFGSGAGAGRNLSAYISVQSNRSLGGQTDKQASFSNCLQTIQDMAKDSEQGGISVYFDLVPNGQGLFEFRTYIGQTGRNRTSGIDTCVMSLQDGTLRSGSYGFDYSGAVNVLYGLGQELNGARQIVSSTDSSTVALSPFSRRESSVDARKAILTPQLQAECDAELARQKPKSTVVADVADGRGSRYGIDWILGDRIIVQLGGNLYPCLIDNVHVSVSGDREQIQATLRF